MSSINTAPAHGIDQWVPPLVGRISRLNWGARMTEGENGPVEQRIRVEEELGSAV